MPMNREYIRQVFERHGNTQLNIKEDHMKSASTRSTWIQQINGGTQ